MNEEKWFRVVNIRPGGDAQADPVEPAEPGDDPGEDVLVSVRKDGPWIVRIEPWLGSSEERGCEISVQWDAAEDAKDLLRIMAPALLELVAAFEHAEYSD